MSRLTEQEQQEIIRYIEADKPLPDRFRFLLFEDKRESVAVELTDFSVGGGISFSELDSRKASSAGNQRTAGSRTG